ncbi:hypothetical protein QP179_09910 [Sphingomonas aurantiaca]|uniref:hypothetical protein n=1 Tax=Sphingomonas aurantiaca TaxID=185949 RepID=UPI002FE30184
MITTVGELIRELQNYRDDFPIDDTGRNPLIIDNNRERDTLLTMETIILRPYTGDFFDLGEEDGEPCSS